MKKLVVILILLLSFIGCTTKNYTYSSKDEKLIKEFRSHQNYKEKDLKDLKIKKLGVVDDYTIYDVPYKGSNGTLNKNSIMKNNYTFSDVASTRIIGIKGSELFTLGNLVYEVNIDLEKLYELIPDKYKN